MITEKSREELIEIGAKQRASYLVQQAGYTLGLAAEEEEAIEEVLEDPQLVEDVTAAMDEVKTGTQDLELMRQEAKNLTTRQDEALGEAKVWRRKAVARAKRAKRRGKNIPDELLAIGRASSVPGITEQLTVMTATFATHVADLGGPRAQALLEKGQTILTTLSTADAEQEVARLALLPEKVLRFYEAKGRLYLGIKLLNDGGHELHADDLAQAARYNLKILRRRAPKRAKDPANPST